MPGCALKTCKSHSRLNNKDNGVTFHRFLPVDHENREKWIKFVQKNRNEDTWLPTNHSYICSEHFIDDDKIITKTGRTYLKKHALPYDKNALSPVKSEINSSTENLASVSDSESIFDTPREIMLKAKLSKETAARNQLTVKFRKVQRQNIYLKKKCESYKLLINKLKRIFGRETLIEMMKKHGKFSTQVKH